MKNAYYFSHDSNARNDEKMLCLRAEHGAEGYGIFWILAEMMFDNKNTSLSHKLTKGIAYQYNIDITVLSGVINTCIEVGLFETNETEFWSNSLRRRKEDFENKKRQKSEAGKKGMLNRWANKEGENKVSYNGVITENNKGKESKGNKNKEDNIFLLEIVSFLNEKSGKQFKATSEKTKTLIRARLNENYSLEDFKKVINIKSAEWKGTEMDKYLCPETLFGTKFEKYLNQSASVIPINNNQPQKVGFVIGQSSKYVAR